VIGYSRGDTIIEVLLAITVFSLVSVGGISLMNQGTAIAQRALEIDWVRQQMDTQTDALRFLNRQHIKNPNSPGVWSDITARYTVDKAQEFEGMINGSDCVRHAIKPFALDVSGSGIALLGSIQNASTYAQVSGSVAQGLWIEAVHSSSTPHFYDFHIRACWNTSGQSAPITLGTIVRLYEPNN